MEKLICKKVFWMTQKCWISHCPHICSASKWLLMWLHAISHSISRKNNFSHEYSISVIFGACQMAVTSHHHPNEIQICHQKILAHCIQTFERNWNQILVKIIEVVTLDKLPSKLEDFSCSKVSYLAINDVPCT